MIESSLLNYLEGVSAISALVGTRIYPVSLPQDVKLPAISVQRISGFRIPAHSGRTKFARPRFQINIWSHTYAEAKNVAKQVQIALEGFSGTMESTEVHAIRMIGDRDDYQPDVKNYRVMAEFEIWHTEES